MISSTGYDMVMMTRGSEEDRKPGVGGSKPGENKVWAQLPKC